MEEEQELLIHFAMSQDAALILRGLIEDIEECFHDLNEEEQEVVTQLIDQLKLEETHH